MDITVEQIAAECQQKGITLYAKQGRIGYTAPKNAVTPQLKSLIAENKAELIRHLTIQGIAEDIPIHKWLSDQQFTDKLVILLEAHGQGILSDTDKDQGLGFLMEHWRPGQRH